jgi:hypothetical protein
MSICDEHSYIHEDRLAPDEMELIKIAEAIKRLGLKVRLTLDAESAVAPFPAAPGDEIDDIRNGFFRFGDTYLPISRVDVINLDFGSDESKRNDVLRELARLLEHSMSTCCDDDSPTTSAEVEALRKLLLHKSRENKKIRTIDTVRVNVLDATVDKEIGLVGVSTVLIPYKVGALYLLAVFSLKNIRLIEFV